MQKSFNQILSIGRDADECKVIVDDYKQIVFIVTTISCKAINKFTTSYKFCKIAILVFFIL